MVPKVVHEAQRSTGSGLCEEALKGWNITVMVVKQCTGAFTHTHTHTTWFGHAWCVWSPMVLVVVVDSSTLSVAVSQTKTTILLQQT